MSDQPTRKHPGKCVKCSEPESYIRFWRTRYRGVGRLLAVCPTCDFEWGVLADDEEENDE